MFYTLYLASQSCSTGMQVALASSIMAWVRSGELVDEGQEELQNGGTLLAAQVPSPRNML